MSSALLPWTRALRDYLREVSVRESDAQRALRAETAKLPAAGMQISPEQGQFMAWLVQVLQVRRALEIGTFTGYSALTVAQALPDDGRLIACDVSEEWTAIGRVYWERAGVAGKIELRLAPALQTLDALLADGEAGRFDFVFIDADKENYPRYYERALTLLRPGGVIAIDNVLWGGGVIDPHRKDADTEAIRALNRRLSDDPRVRVAMIPVGDGLTLAWKPLEGAAARA